MVQQAAELVVVVIARIVGEHVDGVENRVPLGELEEPLEVEALPAQRVGPATPILGMRAADEHAVGIVDRAVIVDIGVLRIAGCGIHAREAKRVKLREWVADFDAIDIVQSDRERLVLEQFGDFIVIPRNVEIGCPV